MHVQCARARSAEFSCTMYSTVAVAAVAMCCLLPISVDAIELQISPRNLISGAENTVWLQCQGTTAMATFHRMGIQDSPEELSAATVMKYDQISPVVVTFVLDGATEGLYFCTSGGDESPKRKLVGE